MRNELGDFQVTARAHNEARKILLCGAGLSYATLGLKVTPISRDFGEVFAAVEPNWKCKYPFLWVGIEYLSEQAGVDPRKWALDEVWDGIDENFKLRRIIRHNDFKWPADPPRADLYEYYCSPSWNNLWILAGVELKQAVVMMYGLQPQETTRSATFEGSWIVNQISQLSPNDLIVTTNYDLLIEEVVRKVFRSPDYENCLRKWDFKSRRESGKPPIAKLHGSVDWVFATNWVTRNSYVERTPDRAPMAPKDIGVDSNFWERRPLLVPPIQHKDEVLFPAIQPNDLVEVLTTQWKRFMDGLEHAGEMVVGGYSFPPGDAYGMRMIQEALRKRKGSRKIKVELWPLSEDMEGVERRLSSGVFGQAFKLERKEKIPEYRLDSRLH